jgi:4-hydroxy-3-polyprenylbenzoate decarboxylase
MGYRRLRDCVRDLERTGRLFRVEVEVDPRLEAAEIHRRVNQVGGPALYFPRLKGCRFPAVSNLFGTIERTEFIFRDAIERVRRLIELKIDPSAPLQRPLRYAGAPWTALAMLPKKVRRGPILECETQIERLPAVQSWPKDGGPFITLPQVYTEHPGRPGLASSNLGMYRVQLSGNQYRLNHQVGLHYQIHRGIGVHHAAAIERGERLRVVVSVGGPPALAVAAVMPLPEGLSELGFAGALGGRRLRLAPGPGGLPIPAEADFAICGTVDPAEVLPEGPFGDHLGYYSLAHDFPVLTVERVFHRPDAIWPFTVVGRPPQEDTSFGKFIHDLTGPIIPTVVHGVHAVHAVDAAGVHPLLLAIGSERYVPYERERKPRELLTCANAVLGQGQLSLAKYLFIVAKEDDENLDVHDVGAFLDHVLRRVDWTRDLHFQTSTTIDTLDYSGTGLNEGSKLVVAVAGPVRRELPDRLPAGLAPPEGFSEPHIVRPGILAIRGPAFRATGEEVEPAVRRLIEYFPVDHPINAFPMIVVVDDSRFASASLENFLWTTFTRSNPAADVHGIGGEVRRKHYGCRGALVVDARAKPHHAPPVEPDPDVARRVENLAAPGGPLHGLF